MAVGPREKKDSPARAPRPHLTATMSISLKAADVR